MHNGVFYFIIYTQSLSKIISIGTALPKYCHRQSDIMQFMQQVYTTNEAERRKLRFLYAHSGIGQRYSVISDYSRTIQDWKFYPQSEGLTPFPTLEQRMAVYNRYAPQLSIAAIRNCLEGVLPQQRLTHLITVSCTGMSAPGLDLQIVEDMDLPKNIFRTSVNFMGCYAAIHAMRLAHALVAADKEARVMIVCTELCTLHFQREATVDNIASALLFGDGSAAALVVPDGYEKDGIIIDDFYSEIISKGRQDMAWELSSTGFLMTLSSYVPQLIEEDFSGVVQRAAAQSSDATVPVSHWCIHPGGRRILESVQKAAHIGAEMLQPSYEVLQEVGNLSSATILFVLKKWMQGNAVIPKMLGAAFGPGITVETFTAHRN